MLFAIVLSGIGFSACGAKCEHQYSDIVTSPTCTEQGYTTHTCNLCGDTYIDSYQDAAHNYGFWIAEVAATCEQKGAIAHYHCSGCNKNFDANYDEIENITISVLSHNYGTWVNEVPVTCTTDGVKGHYTCLECEKHFDTDKNEISDISITPINHTYVDGKCTGCSANEMLFFDEQANECYFIGVSNDCTDTKIVIPKYYNGKLVTEIESQALYSYSTVTSITIPNTVIRINVNAFNGCSNLEEVIIPSSVKYISTYAFQNCSGLTSITIPSSVKLIQGGVFSGCKNLTSLLVSI